MNEHVRWIRLDIVTSTNKYARQLLAEGKLEGPTCITAREQTAGRGRFDRQWSSPRDAGLYMTVACKSRSIPPPQGEILTTRVSEAAASAIRSILDVEPEIRPVNDLYLSDRKIGGVLVECVCTAKDVFAMIAGIGINIFPAERIVTRGKPPAGCLAETVAESSLTGARIEALQDAIAEKVLPTLKG